MWLNFGTTFHVRRNIPSSDFIQVISARLSGWLCNCTAWHNPPLSLWFSTSLQRHSAMTTLQETLPFPASHDTSIAGEQNRLGGSFIQRTKWLKQWYLVATNIVNCSMYFHYYSALLIFIYVYSWLKWLHSGIHIWVCLHAHYKATATNTVRKATVWLLTSEHKPFALHNNPVYTTGNIVDDPVEKGVWVLLEVKKGSSSFDGRKQIISPYKWEICCELPPVWWVWKHRRWAITDGSIEREIELNWKGRILNFLL